MSAPEEKNFLNTHTDWIQWISFLGQKIFKWNKNSKACAMDAQLHSERVRIAAEQHWGTDVVPSKAASEFTTWQTWSTEHYTDGYVAKVRDSVVS